MVKFLKKSTSQNLKQNRKMFPLSNFDKFGEQQITGPDLF